MGKVKCADAGSSGAVYGLGFIGAVIYFFQQADSFWLFVFAIPKAMVWPAFVVYKLLESFYGIVI